MTSCRAIAARANYLAQDRADISFAVKECTRKMQSPGGSDMQRLKQLERCQKGAPRAVMWFKEQDDLQIIGTFIHRRRLGRMLKNEEVEERRSDQERIT